METWAFEYAAGMNNTASKAIYRKAFTLPSFTRTRVVPGPATQALRMGQSDKTQIRSKVAEESRTPMERA
jgi:hypothetical protein